MIPPGNAVGEMRWPTSFHAHGVQFGDFFGSGKQVRHAPKRYAREIQIEPRGDNADA
jgi:hypothetical protein